MAGALHRRQETWIWRRQPSGGGFGRLRLKPERGILGALNQAEREELVRLRRENKRLQMERDILKKATAFFARESE